MARTVGIGHQNFEKLIQCGNSDHPPQKIRKNVDDE